jgi:putative transposase
LCREFFRTFAETSVRWKGVRLFVADKCLGLVESVNEFYPRRYCSGARCIFTATWGRWCHKQSEGSRGDAEGGSTSRRCAAAQQKAEQVTAKLRDMKLSDPAAIVTAGSKRRCTATVAARPLALSANEQPAGGLLREVRRKTRAVGAFPDGKSALLLAATRLRHVASTKWGMRRYLRNSPIQACPRSRVRTWMS